MSNPNPQAPPAPQTPPAQSADDVAALKAELASVKNALSETQQTAQFWHGKATAGAPATPAKPADDDEEDVLDLITSKGAKGLEAMLAKKGFVQAKDVDARIEERAVQITREADLISRYPELKDRNSDFFKAVAGEYGALVNDGVPKTRAMELAAKNVELDGIHSGARKSRKQVEADEAAERETQRLARINAQSGNRGGGGGGSEDENEDLSPEQKRIAISMLAGEPGADGKPMTADQAVEVYKLRAKKGVAVRGLR